MEDQSLKFTTSSSDFSSSLLKLNDTTSIFANEKISSELSFLAYCDSLTLLSVAIFVVAYGAYRSLEAEQWLKKKNVPLEQLSLRAQTAFLFPVIASISLLLFFYFFSLMSLIAILSVCVHSMIGISFFFYPFFRDFFPSLSINLLRFVIFNGFLFFKKKYSFSFILDCLLILATFLIYLF